MKKLGPVGWALVFFVPGISLLSIVIGLVTHSGEWVAMGSLWFLAVGGMALSNMVRWPWH